MQASFCVSVLRVFLQAHRETTAHFTAHFTAIGMPAQQHRSNTRLRLPAASCRRRHYNAHFFSFFERNTLAILLSGF